MKHFRSAINVRYDLKMEKVLKRMKIKTLMIGGGYPRGFEDPVVEALANRMIEAQHPFEAVVALGAQGIEPSLYLFADDAVEVARLAMRIARVFSETE
jgi:predicted fused transcriptional regulator/phosphomethylpyrimidine kinase